MNFEQLQILTSIAKTRNYRHSAKQLKLASKDVRKGIASLEKELGYTLVEEQPNGSLTLTIFGEEVASTSVTMLDMKQTMLYMLDDLKNGNGNLNINLGSTLPSKQHNLYKDYKQHHPGLNINYKAVNNYNIEMLLNNEIDILECEKYELPNELQFTEIETLPLQVYISSTSDLFINKSIKLTDLKDFKLYISNSKSLVLEKLTKQLTQDNISYELIDSNDLTIFKVCDKDSAYIQEPIITYPYATIKVLPLEDERFNYTYGLAYKKNPVKIVENLINSIPLKK